jgi:cytochrome c556
MNKVLMGLVLSSLFAASSLLAAEKTVIDSKEKVHRTMLMKDMRSMLDAMEEIQKGGFYSSTEDMKTGVKKLQGTLKVLESNEIKFILPKDQVYAYKFAQKTASMLRLYSDDMIASIEAGRMDDALEDYTQLLKQCTSCHIRIRNW